MQEPRRPVIELDVELRHIRAGLVELRHGQDRLLTLVSWWPLLTFLAGAGTAEVVLRLFLGRG